MLIKAGFKPIPERGKGIHGVWAHPLYNGSIMSLKYQMIIQWSEEDNLYLVT